MILRRCAVKRFIFILFILLCPLIIVVCVQFLIDSILPRSVGRNFSCLVVEKEELESHERSRDIYYNYYNNISGDSTTYDIEQIRYEVPSKPCDPRHQPFLLVCILSSPSAKSLKLRKAIRQTWASNIYNGQVRFVFFVGHSKLLKNRIRGRLIKESSRHGDIVLIDYEDTYHKISYKSVSILKWCSNYCSNSKYIAKVDEDMFLDLPNLLLVLNSLDIPKVILGFVINEGKPNRNTRSKWYVPERIYKYEHYPVYTSGATYVLSTDLLSGLLLAASQSPTIPNEDVFITGICGKKAGATLLGHCGFNVSKLPVYIWAYRFFVNAHNYTPEEFRDIWNIKNTLLYKSQKWLKYTSLLFM